MAYEYPADGSTPKRLRTSNTAADVPVAAEIQEDEVLLNTADGLLYYKTPGGTVSSLKIEGTDKVDGLDAALAAKLESPIAISDTTGLQDALDGKVASTTATAIVALTDAAYTALTPKVATTLYIITDASAGGTGVYLGSTVIASKAL